MTSPDPIPSPQPQPPVLIQPGFVTAYLHEEIPLTRAIGMTVTSWDGRSVTLSAPLPPNLNHADTAFGGSISCMGIMAGYCLVYLLLGERRISNRLLIQKSEIEYLRPIDAEFTATASVAEPAVMDEFFATLLHRRRARLELISQIHSQRMLTANHKGLYVAMLY
jgi:thioesterase domain-containing protein